MNQRRIVVNLKPTSWLGWLLLVLLAAPLLVLSFFFLTVALVLVAVMVVLATARIYWLRHKMRSRDPTPGGKQRGDIIDVESVDITHTSQAESAAPTENPPPGSR